MLTNTTIKALKPQSKMRKVSDRDSMYVRVMPSGAKWFRLNYRLNGRRETVCLSRANASSQHAKSQAAMLVADIHKRLSMAGRQRKTIACDREAARANSAAG